MEKEKLRAKKKHYVIKKSSYPIVSFLPLAFPLPNQPPPNFDLSSHNPTTNFKERIPAVRQCQTRYLLKLKNF